jgi:hypothetical protein
MAMAMAFLVSGALIHLDAQVRIGARGMSRTTLEVTTLPDTSAIADGIMAPRLTGDKLALAGAKYGNNQNDAVVYVTAAATSPAGKTINVKKAGYYYYDAPKGVWIPVATGTGEWFYMPTTVLPTTTDNTAWKGDHFELDIYAVYKQQLGMTYANSAASESITIPTYDADQLAYLVMYYDSAVFQSVSVSTAGVLSYKVVAGAVPTEATFMNLVFVVK